MFTLAVSYIIFWAILFHIWFVEGKKIEKFHMKDSLLNLDKVTRLEVISNTREYQNHNVKNCQLSLQDKEKTLKVFISN